VYGAARLREAIPPLRLEAPDPPQVSEDVTNTVRLAHIVSAAQYALPYSPCPTIR
jgi:hypothetical protein